MPGFENGKSPAKKRKAYMSFRTAVFIALFLCGLVPAVLLGLFMRGSFFDSQLNNQSLELQSEIQVLANQLSERGYLDGRNSAVIESRIAQTSSIHSGRTIVIDKDFRIICDTFHIDEGKIAVSENVLASFRGETVIEIDRSDRLIKVTQPILNMDNGEVVGSIVVTASIERVYSLSHAMNQRIIMGLIVVFVLMIPFAFWLSGKAVRPFDRLLAQMNESALGNPENIYEMNDFKETHEIASSLNDIVRRLHTLSNDRHQFVSNVSHELKTPIAAIRVLTDSLLEQEDVPAEIYREFMTDISGEIDRESAIIEDLLAAVRLEKSNEGLRAQKVDINEFLERIMKRLKPLALKARVELVFESYRQVTAEIDEVKLSQAVSNIIENGIKYNREGGYVRATLNADHRYMYITIADNGIGIPDAAKEKVFERFYRAEQSRSRELGGTGLGLSISQSIVFLHNGAIKFESEEGEGTTFTIRIPLIYIP